jgi:cyclomaltodextrinase / maltogenic alpha-amylase / neopullulanase
LNKNTRIIVNLIPIVLCCISYFGCAKKEYQQMKARMTSEMLKRAVLCEVDLRTFQNNGTFKSFEAEIPAIKKRGITVLAFAPIHPVGELNKTGLLGSPDAVKDLYSVSPELGTLDDFRSLVSTVHQQGLKIIINLVLNQAAWDSPMLMEHPDWFVQNEEGAIVAPNAERSDVAQIDFHGHELRKYMIAVMKFWIQDIGIDGFQCLSAESIPTDFWEVARSELDKAGQVFLISDGRLPEYHLKAFDVTRSWDIDHTVARILDQSNPASSIYDSLNTELRQFPQGSIFLRFSRSFDHSLDDTSVKKKLSPQITHAQTILAYTLPGIPLLSTNDCFGKENDLGRSQKILEELMHLRQSHPALQTGDFQRIQNSDSSHVASFLRSSEGDTVLVVINFAHKATHVEIQIPCHDSLTWTDQFSGVKANVENARLHFALGPLECMLMVPTTEKEMR